MDLRRPGVSMEDLADLVANLSPGCALWRATGGPMAWSLEMHAIVGVAHKLDVLAWQNTGVMQRKPRGEMPKPIPPQPFTGADEVSQARSEEKRIRRQARRTSRSLAERVED